MSEPVQSVILAGRGLLRWPGGEERVHYRVTIGLDNTIGSIHVSEPTPPILTRPSRHGRIFLHMPEGRRLALNVAATGHLTPDAPMERSLDGQDWWLDTTPWLPFETPDRFTLAIKAGPVQISSRMRPRKMQKQPIATTQTQKWPKYGRHLADPHA